MEVFCPRCDNSISEITSQLIDSGACPKCLGQVYLGQFEGVLQVEGAVAMFFEPGCNIGVPLDPYGEVGGIGAHEKTSPGLEATVPLSETQHEDRSLEPRLYGDADTTGVVTLDKLLIVKKETDPEDTIE